MPDLIGAFERVRRVYRWYIESAFPLRSEALSREREALLDRVGSGDVPGTLAQPPLIEPVTVYERSPYNLRETSLQLPKEYQDVQYLAGSFSRRKSNFTSTNSTPFALVSKAKMLSSRPVLGPGRRKPSFCHFWPIWHGTPGPGLAARCRTIPMNAMPGPRRDDGGRRTMRGATSNGSGNGRTMPNGPMLSRNYPLSTQCSCRGSTSSLATDPGIS